MIVDAIKVEAPHFTFSEYDDPRLMISQYFRYIHFNRRTMNRIYDIAYGLMKRHCSRNDVVLLGTKDLMHLADRVFIQQDDDIVRSGFRQDNEQDKVHQNCFDNIHYIDNYLDGCLQKLCAGKL